MVEAKVPIFGTVCAAWREFFSAVFAMPRIAAIAFAAVFFTTALDRVLEEAVTLDAEAPLLWRLLQVIGIFIYCYLTAPLGIALYRYVMTGEITERYGLSLSSPRFRAFFAYSVLLSIPAIIFLFLHPEDAFVLWITLGFAISASTIILFPAIAVDAPGARLWNAVRDTHFWRALLILIVASLPALLLFVALMVLWFDPTHNAVFNWLVYVFLLSGIDFAFVAANVVAAPLYLAWAIRLKGL